MRLKNDEAINEMAGKRLYSIYADYVDGTPKEYEGKIKEYIILGTSRETNGKVILWDIGEQKVCEEWRGNIHSDLNRNSIQTRIWRCAYAYAFTKEAAEKCLSGLQASIDANYERTQKWAQIKTKSYTFTLDKLENSGLQNLVHEGVAAIDVTTYDDPKPVKFCLPDDYEKIMDQRGLNDLHTLGFIGTGKHIFENNGNDVYNPDEKGKIIPERDIMVLVEISENERGKRAPVKTFKSGDKCYTRNIKWIKPRVYVKLPHDNYIAIKKFNKFFNMFALQKVN